MIKGTNKTEPINPGHCSWCGAPCMVSHFGGFDPTGCDCCETDKLAGL